MRDRRLSRFVSSLRQSKRWASLTPELLFQSLSETLLTKLTSFFTFLCFSRPNVGHAVLAHLGEKLGQPILTTNFDTLIEATMKTANVVHLHGDLNRPEELVFRINQVGRGMDAALREKALTSLANRTLYVFGYSGADRDIVHVLRESSVRRLQWIVHPDPTLRGAVESIGNSLRKECKFVAADLRRVFTVLANKWGLNIGPKTDTLARKRREQLGLWASSLTFAEAWASVGDAHELAEQYDQARNVYLRGLHFADAKLSKSWFLNEVANAMYIAGRFEECEYYGKRAIRSNGQNGDVALLAGSRNLLGLAKLENEKPAPRAALKHFHVAKLNAERVMKRSRPTRLTQEALQRFVSRLYNNIGLAYANTGKFRLARKYYFRSLHIKKRRGDLVGMAKTAGNLCCLDYASRQFRTAQYWKRKAFEIVDRYDLAFDRAYIFRRLGEMSCEQGRKGNGLRYLRTALSLYSENPDLHFGVRLTKKSILKYE
jgi:tetratricopeptide (TPR) repeat protein